MKISGKVKISKNFIKTMKKFWGNWGISKKFLETLKQLRRQRLGKFAGNFGKILKILLNCRKC